MSRRTTFTDPAAVEAWDAWFRWRQGGVLHDRTIDATWSRAVQAVAAVEDAEAGPWSQTWLRGLSRWQWLPDETLLRDAGTRAAPRRSGPILATLNISAFVRRRSFGSSSGELDAQAIADRAEATLRFLDDALLAMPPPESPGIRIGLMGVADALSALGIEYDSPAALQVAQATGAALASGALRGAVELARERGGDEPARGRLEFLADHGLSRSLVADALRWGVRHELRTAIAPAPRLALLANNASDALDPRPSRPATSARGDAGADTSTLPSAAAQWRLRSAIQPWIDEPIDYPIASTAGRREAPGAPSPGPSAPFSALHQETVAAEGVRARAGDAVADRDIDRETP